MVLNLAFSGAGFLGIYHIGVVSCLKFYGKKLLDKVYLYGGSSAGALAACMLLCDMDLEESVQFVMHTASKVNSTMLGPLSSKFDPSATIRKTFLTYLPVNAHKIASGKIHISLTRVSDWKNEIVSEFNSNKELVDALVCSSFIPFFSGVIPPKFRGKHYIDGGFTDNLPQHFEGTTITVSPFSGESDICPDDGHKTSSHFDLRNTSVQVTGPNIYRMARALFPPDSDTLAEMCRHGFQDTLKYLNNNYPEALDIGVSIVSIPQCCDLTETGIFDEEDDNSACSMCSCENTSNEESYLNDMETCIAQKLALNTLVFPEQLNTILQKTKEVFHESDLCWYLLKTLFNITKWIAQPYVYVSGHIHEFIEEIFQCLLPKIKELCSYNSYTKGLLEFIFEVYHAYKGTSKVEWHPSLKLERCSDIERTNKRILTATKSLVAMPKFFNSMIPCQPARSGYEPPPPSRVPSCVGLHSEVIFSDFDIFESEASTDNDASEVGDEIVDHQDVLQMKTFSDKDQQVNTLAGCLRLLAEDDEFLIKDEDGLLMVSDSKTSQEIHSSSTESNEDYGCELNYKLLSSETFHLTGESCDDLEDDTPDSWNGFVML